MKEIYKKTLNEFLRKYGEDVNDTLLLALFQVHGLVTANEASYIDSKQSRLKKLTEMFQCIFPKDDACFTELEEIFEKQNWCDYKLYLKENVRRLSVDNGIDENVWQSETERILKDENEIPTTHVKVVKALKLHYRSDLQYMKIYWNQFSEPDLNVHQFYNPHIDIIDIQKRTKEKALKSFQNIYDCLDNSKRLLIFSNPGCGKSTFLHQVAQEWVNGVEKWTKDFWFVFLFRLGELKEKDSKTLEDLLRICLTAPQAKMMDNLLSDPTYLEKSMFIFDAYDELKVDLCDEIKNLIFGPSPQIPLVIVSTRPSHLENLKRGNVRCIELKGFNDTGIKQQVAQYQLGHFFLCNQHESVFHNPLFLTLFCICPTPLANICCSWELLRNYFKKLEERFFNINQQLDTKFIKNLLLKLSKFAMNQCSIKTDYHAAGIDELTDEEYNLAKAIGYIQNRQDKCITFPHYTILEYFAAYYWTQQSFEFVKILSPMNLMKPQKIYFHSHKEHNLGDIFIQAPNLVHTKFFHFWCHFDEPFRNWAWKNFDNRLIPWISNIDTITKRDFDISTSYFPFLNFSDSMPENERSKIKEKLRIISTSDNVLFVNRNITIPQIAIDNEVRIKQIIAYECNFEKPIINYFHNFSKLLQMNIGMCTTKEDRISDAVNKNRTETVLAMSQQEKMCTCLMETVTVTLLSAFTDFDSFTTLKVLRFKNCNFSPFTLHSLADSLKSGKIPIQELWFVDEITVGSCPKLMESICSLSNLKVLLIADCNLANESLSRLAPVAYLPKLDLLNISGNSNVGRHKYFLNELAKAENIRVLYIHLCDFKTEGTVQFFTSFKSFSILQHLSLTVQTASEKKVLEDIFRSYKLLKCENLTWY